MNKADLADKLIIASISIGLLLILISFILSLITSVSLSVINYLYAVGVGFGGIAGLLYFLFNNIIYLGPSKKDLKEIEDMKYKAIFSSARATPPPQPN
jgi:hypothetical protein